MALNDIIYHHGKLMISRARDSRRQRLKPQTSRSFRFFRPITTSTSPASDFFESDRERGHRGQPESRERSLSDNTIDGQSAPSPRIHIHIFQTHHCTYVTTHTIFTSSAPKPGAPNTSNAARDLRTKLSAELRRTYHLVQELPSVEAPSGFRTFHYLSPEFGLGIGSKKKNTTSDEMRS
jgi:hypothetical protein